MAYERPVTVTYCHCDDCRRITGAPVAAFAAFPDAVVDFSPVQGDGRRFGGRNGASVDRWFCGECGTPLAARFDDLPGQTYVPIGIIDQAAELPPSRHAHVGAALPWLCIDDDLPRDRGTVRGALRNGPNGG